MKKSMKWIKHTKLGWDRLTGYTAHMAYFCKAAFIGVMIKPVFNI